MISVGQLTSTCSIQNNAKACIELISKAAKAGSRVKRLIFIRRSCFYLRLRISFALQTQFVEFIMVHFNI